jgi:acetyl-CoA acetyltransferase
MVAAKNHNNGSLNPNAQYQERYTVQEILDSPAVAEPLTRLMCAPIGDGAAAAVIASGDIARQYSASPVWIRGTALVSGSDDRSANDGTAARAVSEALEMAGMTIEDIGTMEVHDASAPAELLLYEEIGLCKPGEGGRLVAEGATEIGGRIPVNTSGGLLAKGHPVGATGISQAYEIWLQLRGLAGDRQVSGAKTGLTHNGGGMVRGEAAATAVHVFAL